ncbi:MAG: virginiamycin B lyase family protein, partial [Candidatus Binatia bacterium]
PTVVGWEYHLYQQARPPEAIDERVEDVRELYSTTDPERAAALLRRYHVDLVFVGGLERRTYPAAGLRKFADSELMRPIFRNRDVTVYATPGLLQTAKTWIEEVRPQPAARPIAWERLREPRDVARSPNGGFYVADFGHRRIVRFDETGKAIGAFGSEGSEPGQFRDPCGVAVAPDGTVWVADTWNHRIQQLSADGEYLSEWSAGLYGPRGVAVAPDGSVLVTDTGNHRLLRWTPAGGAREIVGRDVLKSPIGVAVDGRGEVYVADTEHRRVVVLSLEGAVLREWPIDGWKPGSPLEPYLDVGPDGTVWVTDPGANRVLLFDSEGRPLGAAASERSLARPLGIAASASSRAMVANAGNDSIGFVERPGVTPY